MSLALTTPTADPIATRPPARATDPLSGRRCRASVEAEDVDEGQDSRRTWSPVTEDPGVVRFEDNDDGVPGKKPPVVNCDDDEEDGDDDDDDDDDDDESGEEHEDDKEEALRISNIV